MKKALLLIVPMMLCVYMLKAQTVYTFNYTGGVQSWTVPEGVSAILIDAYGAAGGDGKNGSGGKGGRSQGYTDVIPGQVLNIYVGGQGGVTNILESYAIPGYNGGGNAYLYSSSRGPVGAGGGASDIRIAPYSLANRIIVAGGGGGGAGSGWLSGPGGAGGGSVGKDAIDEYLQKTYNRGGTQTTGGANPHVSDYNGQWGKGGDVWSNFHHSSGGGGGYYGGAAGICSGGAGGSGYIGGVANGSTVADARSGNGCVIIKAGNLQFITFNELAPVTYGVSPFTISATKGSSGNPVIFTSSDPGIARCSGTNGATITVYGAGSCTIYANEAGNATYLPAQSSQTLTINKKAVTITGVTASTKIYDGTTAAALTTGTLNGTVGYYDYVYITKGSGTFENKDVGSNKTVTATGYGITEYDASNYYLSAQPSGITASITPKALTVINAAVSSKIYDGNTDASITGATLSSGVIGSEIVTLDNANSGTFSQAGAGANISVASAITITGADAGNYMLNQPTLTGNILPKELIVMNASVTPKAYDGNTDANLAGATLSGLIGSDVVMLENTARGTYAQAVIGSGIPVAAAMTLTGTEAANYTLIQPILTGDILVKALTVSNASVLPKVYNKITDAVITGATLSGVIGSEFVTLENATSGTFARASAGAGIQVFTAMAIAGNGKDNYTLSQPNLTGDILPIALTVTNATVSSKIYDGNTNASITGATLSPGVIGSEVVTLDNANSGTFSQAGAGANISVASAITITGADAGNYMLTQPTLTGNILPKELIVMNASVTPKAYDGNTDANLAGATLSGLIGSDVVMLENTARGTYAQAVIGSGIPVAAAMTLTGKEAANYTLIQPILTGDILVKTLTVSNASVLPKVYNKITDAVITGATLSGVIGSEVVTLENTISGAFAQAGAGSGIQVVTAMTITGADVGNYMLIPPILIGDILPKELTVNNATVSSKTYDGNTDASISGATLSGVIGLDAVTSENTTEGTFSQSAAGSNIPVVPAMKITGADAGNYFLIQPVLAGSITVAELTVIADNCAKTYGDTNPLFTITCNGFVNGESRSAIVEPTIACVALQTSNVDNYDIVLSGGSAANYQLILIKGTLTINKAMLTVSADNLSRTQGEPNPVFTSTYAGFKNGETDDVLDIRPILTCTADVSSLAGDYDITVADGADNNYDFTCLPGKLTITSLTGYDSFTASGYSVYPNPFTNYLIIKGMNANNTNIKVYDMSGRLLIESKLVNEQLDVQSLEPGLYNLVVNGYSFKLVKN